MSANDLSFFHGITTSLLADQSPPIEVLKSSVIGIVGSAPRGPVNSPTLLVGNYREAVALFGEPHNDGFTLPLALKAIFEQAGATVVVVNVADPEQCAATIAGETLSFSKVNSPVRTAKRWHIETPLTMSSTVVYTKAAVSSAAPAVPLIANCTVTTVTIKLPSGTFVPLTLTTHYTVTVVGGLKQVNLLWSVILAANPTLVSPADVRVTYVATAGLIKDTDYSYDTAEGSITLLVGSSVLTPSVVSVNYTYFSPAAVTASDIIGTQEDTTATGILVLRSAETVVRVRPRLLLAPGWTQSYALGTRNAVVEALNASALLLGGRVLADAPNTTKIEAANHGGMFTGPTDRVYMHFPNYRVIDPDGNGTSDYLSVPASAHIAGHIARVDGVEGWWNSPSNREIYGVMALDKPLSHSDSSSGSDTEYLGSLGLVTTIYTEGFRLWGNRQTNMQFLASNRIADIITESIAKAQRWATDRNIVTSYLEQVVENLKAFFRRLEGQGAIIANPNPYRTNDVWADPTLNTASAITAGNLYIDYRFNPPGIAEHITFRAHVTDQYVTSVITEFANNSL